MFYTKYKDWTPTDIELQLLMYGFLGKYLSLEPNM